MDVHRVGALVCAVTAALIAATPGSAPAAEPTFYVAGMIGPSFATLADSFHDSYAGSDGSINGTVFTAGGAAGYAFLRDNGRLRCEVEGRGRGDLTTTAGIVEPKFSDTANWSASNGWSVLTNVWRDINLTDRLAVYAGGGIGGGGYDYNLVNRLTAGPFTETFASSANVATFAWQAGGGAIYRLSDRVEFDVSYRFFATQQVDTTLYVIPTSGAPPEPLSTWQQGFSASEMLFTLRLYEPFRGLRQRQ